MKWKNIAAETTTFFITDTVTEWQPLLAHQRAREIVLPLSRETRFPKQPGPPILIPTA
ncbi:MAG: hypothetical protein Q7T82_15815 [Armatimonadota bacterium]|nr:hypothetical protein [Armatimonadota bacterium]